MTATRFRSLTPAADARATILYNHALIEADTALAWALDLTDAAHVMVLGIHEADTMDVRVQYARQLCRLVGRSFGFLCCGQTL